MKIRMITVFLFIVSVFLFTMAVFSGEVLRQGKEIVIGRSYTLKSVILNEERELLISLPADYHSGNRSYPVFYLLDGGMQFHNVSGIIEFLSKFKHIPNMILVGIKNVNRERDFLPFKIDNWPPNPSAAKFRTFIREELIPSINSRFRTTDYRILAGHSYGAIFCLYNFMEDPEMFTAFIAISPSLDWGKTKGKELWEKTLEETIFYKKFLYLSISADDYEEGVKSTRELASILKAKSPPGLEFHFEFMPDDDHLTVVHPVIYNALRWLHKGWRIPETSLGALSLEEVKAHYKKLSERYGSEVPPHEGILFNMGYLLFDSGKKEKALEVFEYGLKLYPESAACYLGLGDIHHESGDQKKAMKYYQKALQLAELTKDPIFYPVAKSIVEELKKKEKQ